MKLQFDILRITRNNVLNDIKDLTIEQLNTIPQGFNNNIAWNLAHLVVTQQLLVYGLSGTDFVIEKSLIASNRKGTKPEESYSIETINQVKALMLSTIDRMEQDYQSGIFKDKTYKSYTTSYNITLNSVEEAITFNNVHEGMHYGIIKMMMKFL